MKWDVQRATGGRLDNVWQCFVDGRFFAGEIRLIDWIDRKEGQKDLPFCAVQTNSDSKLFARFLEAEQFLFSSYLERRNKRRKPRKINCEINCG